MPQCKGQINGQVNTLWFAASMPTMDPSFFCHARRSNSFADFFGPLSVKSVFCQWHWNHTHCCTLIRAFASQKKNGLDGQSKKLSPHKRRKKHTSGLVSESTFWD